MAEGDPICVRLANRDAPNGEAGDKGASK
jgi:hypothetical protein